MRTVIRRFALTELRIGRTDDFFFQRRDGKAPTASHRLGWFGGHIDDGESAIDAIKRELAEETSLRIRQSDFKGPRVFEVPAKRSSSKELTLVNLFRVNLRESDTPFTVHEGTRAEIYSYAGLLATNEVAETVRYILEQIIDSSTTTHRQG